MPGPDFLDTNILVYAYDATDTRKQRIARELVRRAIAADVVISSQVLAEFAATLLHKLTPPAQAEDVAASSMHSAPFARWLPISRWCIAPPKYMANMGCTFTMG